MPNVSSLRFRMEVDNASAIRGLSDFQNKVKGLGTDIQQSIAGKIEAAFSVGVIMDMTRRTGEWATELKRSADSIRVNEEYLQALQTAAERAGQSIDSIDEFYNKIFDKADEALKGNSVLLKSFEDLGIEIEDLRKLDMNKIFSNIMQLGPTHATDIVNLFGRSSGTVDKIARQFKGQNLSTYSNNLKESGLVVSSGDVNTIAQAWIDVTTDLKRLGVELKPIVRIILNIFDEVLKMATGLIGGIKAPFLGLKAAFKTVTGQDPNAAKNYLKSEGSRELVAGLSAVNMVTFGASNWLLKKTTGRDYKNLIPNQELRRQAEGAGEGVGMFASFGTSAIGRLLGIGGHAVSSVGGVLDRVKALEKVGIGERMGAFGQRVSNIGKGLSEYKGFLGGRLEKMFNTVFQDMGNSMGFTVFNKFRYQIMSEAGQRAMSRTGKVLKELPEDQQRAIFAEIKEELMAMPRSMFAKIAKSAVEGIQLGQVSKAGKDTAQSNLSNSNYYGPPPFGNVNASIGKLDSVFSGGGSTTGGVFGKALEAKLSYLTEMQQQSEYLSQISSNTKELLNVVMKKNPVSGQEYVVTP